MTTFPILRGSAIRQRACGWMWRGICFAVLAAALSVVQAGAQDQEDPLNKVHVTPPSASTAAANPGAPKGAEAPVATGTNGLKVRPGEVLRMNVDMVLIPVTVTDPMNRLVTGLEQQDFQIYENNGSQQIRSFACEDAPVSIGIIFDLSGSMTSKL